LAAAAPFSLPAPRTRSRSDGPITIDPETRDVIHNIYLRRVEKTNGELWNIEFATVENVKDPVKPARK
jgi:branched-chain amino acid transport system substrate-binding protein